MASKTLTRSNKGMQIAMRSIGQWRPATTGNRIGIEIPSQTKANVTYRTTCDGCDCPDFRYRVGTPGGPTACKHVLAARIFLGRCNAQSR